AATTTVRMELIGCGCCGRRWNRGWRAYRKCYLGHLLPVLSRCGRQLAQLWPEHRPTATSHYESEQAGDNGFRSDRRQRCGRSWRLDARCVFGKCHLSAGSLLLLEHLLHLLEERAHAGPI